MESTEAKKLRMEVKQRVSMLLKLQNHLQEARVLIEEMRNGKDLILKDFAEAEEFDSIEELENIVDEYLN